MGCGAIRSVTMVISYISKTVNLFQLRPGGEFPFQGIALPCVLVCIRVCMYFTVIALSCSFAFYLSAPPLYFSPFPSLRCLWLSLTWSFGQRSRVRVVQRESGNERRKRLTSTLTDTERGGRGGRSVAEGEREEIF